MKPRTLRRLGVSLSVAGLAVTLFALFVFVVRDVQGGAPDPAVDRAMVLGLVRVMAMEQQVVGSVGVALAATGAFCLWRAATPR